MSPVYPGDDAFRSAFAEKSMRTSQARNKKVVRHILCRIEQRLGGAALDAGSDTFNLEHILPENPGVGWDAFTEAEVEALSDRLGNLTLLATGANQDIGNAPFATKRPTYAASAFAITRKVAADNADWTPERIAARQNWMAHQAATLWRIDTPSALP
ncbi:MAG: HNH endonuclease family protein [Verrucomicrobiota bacterium]